MGPGPGSKRSPSSTRLNQASLLPRGLKERLIVAFSLMSVMPLLVLGYVVTTYVFPRLESIGDLSLVVLLTAVIAFLGLAVARGMVMPIIRLASQAQEIASGHLDQQVQVTTGDELGSLGTALNQITQKVRDNMSQLRVYGEQTKHLNLEINRRVVTLSHLLQVSNLISQSAKFEEVAGFIVEKLTQLEEAELNCLLEPGEEDGSFVIRFVAGADVAQAAALQGTRVASLWLARLLTEKRMVILDAEHDSSPGREFLEKTFQMHQAVCQPIVSLGQGTAVLISANRKPDFSFQEDCLDLLKVFGKQVTIAMENDLLNKRAKELEIMDELTGLYNAGYICNRMEEEVQRSIRYHRPCSLVVVNVDGFRQFQEMQGALRGEKLLKWVGKTLASCVTEVDRVGRMAQEEFAVILPEQNKREAVELASSIRDRLTEGLKEFLKGSEQPGPTISAGVSENPIDGSTGSELFVKAAERVQAAKRMGKNQVMAA